jgi:hypothetical protein
MSDKLVTTRLGRILLHCIAAFRDGKLAWHWAGIAREWNLAAALDRWYNGSRWYWPTIAALFLAGLAMMGLAII